MADRVESKGRHEGFTKFQQIETLDEQGDDGPCIHKSTKKLLHKDKLWA